MRKLFLLQALAKDVQIHFKFNLSLDGREYHIYFHLVSI